MISIIILCVSSAVLGGAYPQTFGFYNQPPQGAPLSAPLVLLPKQYFLNAAPNSPYQQFGAPAAVTSQQYNTFSRQHLYQPNFAEDRSGKLTAKQEKEDVKEKKNQQEKQAKKETEEVVQQQNNDNLSEESSARLTQGPDLNEQLRKSPVYFISQQYYSQDGQLGQLNQSPSQIGKESSNAATTEAEPTTTEVSTTESTQDASANLESEDSEDVENKEGLYYLLLPDGKLQKIVYMTKEDLKKMQLSANIQYQNVEPIAGPIYSYNPSNSPYVKVL